MNISSLSTLTARDSWKLIRRTERICQFKNQKTGKLLTVSVWNETDIPDEVWKILKVRD